MDSVRPKRLKKRQTGRVGAVEAEFFNGLLDTGTAVFASEEHEFEVPWPWQVGFKPTANDWDAIGIPHLM